MKIIATLILVFVTSVVSAYNWIFNPDTGHYYTELTPYQNWEAAETEAQSLGAHLVTINNAPENDWVKSTFGLRDGLKTWCWIGLYEIQPYNSDREWSWISGETSDYSNWGIGEPSSSAEHWVAMDGDGWWRDLSEGVWPPPTYYHTAVAESVPEPWTIVMIGLGLIALRRKKC